jgi:hypothetical protein
MDRINQAYGYAAGDRVLAQLGALLGRAGGGQGRGHKAGRDGGQGRTPSQTRAPRTIRKAAGGTRDPEPAFLRRAAGAPPRCARGLPP